MFYKSFCRDQCLLLPVVDYAVEIQLEWMYLQELFDHLHCLHQSYSQWNIIYFLPLYIICFLSLYHLLLASLYYLLLVSLYHLLLASLYYLLVSLYHLLLAPTSSASCPYIICFLSLYIICFLHLYIICFLPFLLWNNFLLLDLTFVILAINVHRLKKKIHINVIYADI